MTDDLARKCQKIWPLGWTTNDITGAAEAFGRVYNVRVSRAGSAGHDPAAVRQHCISVNGSRWAVATENRLRETLEEVRGRLAQLPADVPEIIPEKSLVAKLEELLVPRGWTHVVLQTPHVWYWSDMYGNVLATLTLRDGCLFRSLGEGKVGISIALAEDATDKQIHIVLCDLLQFPKFP